MAMIGPIVNTKKIDINPKKEDFEKVVKEYLAWRISDSIKNGESLGK